MEQPNSCHQGIFLFLIPKHEEQESVVGSLKLHLLGNFLHDSIKESGNFFDGKLYN